MQNKNFEVVEKVHCRIGSLERSERAKRYMLLVHCRIGSLESLYACLNSRCVVHCRIGSLEKCKGF